MSIHSAEHGPTNHQAMHEGHGNHDMMPGMGHPMAFHFGSTEVVLFNFWSITSSIGLIVSCLGIIAVCFLMEFVRWFRLHRKMQRMESAGPQVQQGPKKPELRLIADGLLHAAQLTLGYMLMLVFMTFNVWLCVAVIVGEVTARILFGLLFPQLERLNDALATTETCCG